MLRRTLLAAAAALCLAPAAHAADLAEDFDPAAAPGAPVVPSGWTVQNLSVPVGTTSWFQGDGPDGGVFSAHQGVPTAYIGANYNSVASSGTIDTWLVTPLLTSLTNGDTVSFHTRAVGRTPPSPDRLQLRLSTDGTCDPASSFTTTLVTVNPDLTASGFPTAAWTPYAVTLSGLPAGASGCLAFRYWVTGGGQLGANSNYIGLDTFRFTEDVVAPAPPTIDALTPAAPSTDPTPVATGTAEAGSTVRVYGDDACTGAVLGSGSAEELGGAGIALAVPENATTTPHATATDASGNVSACSAAGPAYVHDTLPPTTTDDVTDATVPGAAVTLTATDGGGAGVAATYYTTGVEPATPTTASAVYDPARRPVLAAGERIRYLSVDALGNAGAPRASQAVRAPTTVLPPASPTAPAAPPAPETPAPRTAPLPPSPPAVARIRSAPRRVRVGREIAIRYTTSAATRLTFTLRRVGVGRARVARRAVAAGRHTLRVLRTFGVRRLTPGRYRLVVAPERGTPVSVTVRVLR